MKSNEEIVSRAQNVFSQSKIKFIYFCGSRSYGTENEESDVDITVVLDKFKGSIQLQIDELDIFVYGTDTFLLKQQFDESIPLYFLAHVDDVLSIDRNLIYLDEAYREDFENYKQVDFKKNLPLFLNCFIQYHAYRLLDGIPKKTHYHILRLRGMLDHLDQVGVFENVIEEPWWTQMMNYKKNWNTDLGNEYIPLLREALTYIENYKEKVMNDELGKHPQSI